MFIKILKHILFIIIFVFIYLLIINKIFTPIFLSNNIIISFAIHPFNICEKEPFIWEIIKKIFIISNIFISFLISFFISKFFFLKKKINKKNINSISKNSLSINLGLNINNELVSISEKSLYQNILITGSIGSGKTSSVMYPITEQLLKYKNSFLKEKLGMLILDVKGNYYSKVLEYSKKYNRVNDLIVIDLSR